MHSIVFLFSHDIIFSSKAFPAGASELTGMLSMAAEPLLLELTFIRIEAHANGPAPGNARVITMIIRSREIPNEVNASFRVMPSPS